MRPDDTPEVITESCELEPSGSQSLSKIGFKPSPTHRELKVRLWSRSDLPPNPNMTKEHVERIVSAKIPDSVWARGQFRTWLWQHPQAEWTERVEFLNHLLLDRLEVTICHADDKTVVNLAKILPELGSKIKRAADKVAATDQLASLTETELLQLIEKSTESARTK